MNKRRWRSGLLLILLVPVLLLAGCDANTTLNKPIPDDALDALESEGRTAPDAGRWPCFQNDPLHHGWQEVSSLPGSFTEAWTFKLQNLVFEYEEGLSVFSRNAVVGPRNEGALVVVGSFDRNVYGLDLKTGKRIWVRSTSGPVTATPAVSADGRKIFIAAGDRSFYCLSADDGSVIWKHETRPWSYTSYASVAGDLATFIWNGREYLAAPMYNADQKAVRNYRDGSIYLLDAADGTLVKKIFITDSLVNGLVVIPHRNGPIAIGATHSGTVYAIDLMSGDYYWKRVLAGRIGGTPVLVQVNDRWLLLAGDSFGAAWVLDAADGRVVYSKKTGLFVNASIAVYPPGNMMAVPSEDRYLYVFDLTTGDLHGKIETGKYLNAAPVFLTAGDRATLLIASMDEKLYWVDVKTMQPIQVFKTSQLRWKYEKRAIATWSSPQAVELDGTIYVLYGDMGGTFHCYTSQPNNN